jgi:hypothetical protein
MMITHKLIAEIINYWMTEDNYVNYNWERNKCGASADIYLEGQVKTEHHSYH